MAIGATTVGPVEEELRDRLKDYRDQNGLPNYDAALRHLLAEAGETKTVSREA